MSTESACHRLCMPHGVHHLLCMSCSVHHLLCMLTCHCQQLPPQILIKRSPCMQKGSLSRRIIMKHKLSVGAFLPSFQAHNQHVMYTVNEPTISMCMSHSMHCGHYPTCKTCLTLRLPNHRSNLQQQQHAGSRYSNSSMLGLCLHSRHRTVHMHGYSVWCGTADIRHCIYNLNCSMAYHMCTTQ